MNEMDDILDPTDDEIRNEWFRHKIREFISQAEKEAYEKDLSTLDIDDITDEAIVEMVKEWRRKKRAN